MLRDFKARYPHGVLTEQEGGVPNDVLNWEAARHVCRKHRVTETVCVDTLPRRRVRFSDIRFLAALPFAVLADLCAEAVARVDAKYAGALGGEDDDWCEVTGWCDFCGCWNGHAHPSCDGAA